MRRGVAASAAAVGLRVLPCVRMALRSERKWELSLTTVELFTIAFPLSYANFRRPSCFRPQFGTPDGCLSRVKGTPGAIRP